MSMSDSPNAPAIQHVPTKACSVCGSPALGGCDTCLIHLEESDEDDWLIDDETAQLLDEIEES